MALLDGNGPGDGVNFLELLAQMSGKNQLTQPELQSMPQAEPSPFGTQQPQQEPQLQPMPNGQMQSPMASQQMAGPEQMMGQQPQMGQQPAPQLGENFPENFQGMGFGATAPQATQPEGGNEEMLAQLLQQYFNNNQGL